MRPLPLVTGLGLLVGLLLPSAARAQAVGPITFSEPEFVGCPGNCAVDGFSTSTVNGVPLPATLSFTYTEGGVGSPNAEFRNPGIPPGQVFVADEIVFGVTVGILGINFGADASTATFGFVLECLDDPITNALTVTGFDAAGTPIGSASFDALDTPGGVFPENQAVFAPGPAFRRIEFDFNVPPPPQCESSGNPGEPGGFGVDNLQYNLTAVPTLPRWALLALSLSLVAAAMWALRRRERTA